MDQKIYQYAVFYQPTRKEIDEGIKAKFIIEPQYIIAPEEGMVKMKASMEIPHDYSTKLDQVKIVTRLF